jgi:uncharacterized membrane protein
MMALAVLAIILVVGAPIVCIVKLFIMNTAISSDLRRIRADIKALHLPKDSPAESLAEAPKPAPQSAPIEPIKSAHPPQPIPQPARPRPIPEAPSIAMGKAAPVQIGRGTIDPPPQQTPPPPNPPSSPTPRRNWEKLIGENILNKVGIAILVLGLAFLVKYSFNLVAEESLANVAMGALGGGVLLFFAHRLRQRMTAFSSVLSGGAIATFYFTVAIAFRDYQLISQNLAFSLMVAVTAFSILLSMAYNKRELAIISLLGGFVTPLLLSTGAGNHIVLFGYLLLLNVGLTVLAYFKQWRELNIISFIATVLFVGTWVYTKSLAPDGHHVDMLLFCTGFYILFFFQSLLYKFKSRAAFGPWEFGTLLSNTALFFAVGMVLLDWVDDGVYKGLFTGALAMFNILFALVAVKRRSTDKNLIYLLVGLGLSFLSIMAPIQLEGNYITLFWATEAALIFWLSLKSGLKLVRYASGLIYLLMLISLVWDWFNIYIGQGIAADPYPLLLNRGVFTNLSVTLSTAALLFVIVRHRVQLEAWKMMWVKPVVQSLLAVLAYATLIFEVNYQADQLITHSFAAKVIVVGTFNAALLLCAYIATYRRYPIANHVVSLLGVVAVLVSFTHYFQAASDARDLWLTTQAAAWPMALYLLMTAMIIAIPIHLGRRFLTNDERREPWATLAVVGTTLLALVFVSQQFDHLSLLFQYELGNDIEHLLMKSRKAGYAVLWGSVAYGLMHVGIKRKFRNMRVVSLLVFLLIIVKLFVFDLKGIPEGGRVIAFIGLGILLLVISFMYQRLKSLLFTETD